MKTKPRKTCPFARMEIIFCLCTTAAYDDASASYEFVVFTIICRQ